MDKFSSEWLAVKIGGSRFALETCNGVIQDWSPNNLRGIFVTLTERGIVVQTLSHLGDKRFELLVPLEYKSKVVSALNLMFQRRRYSCLEFFCWGVGVVGAGVDLTRCFKYLQGSKMLSLVGESSFVGALSGSMIQELEQGGAKRLSDVEGVEGVFFQHATYALDEKIKEKMLSTVRYSADYDLFVGQFSGGLGDLRVFHSLVSSALRGGKSFDECLRSSLEDTLACHKLGVGAESFERLCVEVPVGSHPESEVVLWSLEFFKPCLKNGVLDGSERLYNLENFCNRWLRKLIDGMKDLVGGRLVDAFMAEGGDGGVFETLDTLINIEERLGG